LHVERGRIDPGLAKKEEHRARERRKGDFGGDQRVLGNEKKEKSLCLYFLFSNQKKNIRTPTAELKGVGEKKKS